MNRWAASALGGLFVVAGATLAAAQETGSRTRLDEFSVAPGDGSLGVEQVSPRPEPVQPEPQIRDRSISGSPMPRRRSLSPDQLSDNDQGSFQSQLSDGSNSTTPIPAAGSTPADSRPQGVTRLVGSDRCDPQLPERDLAQCLRILELRAQEFSAPAPPQLSAEQSLLASRSDDELAAVSMGRNRIRFATVQEPNADLDSNQELASIYLALPAAPPIRQPDELPEEAATLADIIVAITQGAPPPSPN